MEKGLFNKENHDEYPELERYIYGEWRFKYRRFLINTVTVLTIS